MEPAAEVHAHTLADASSKSALVPVTHSMIAQHAGGVCAAAVQHACCVGRGVGGAGCAVQACMLHIPIAGRALRAPPFTSHLATHAAALSNVPCLI